MTMFQNSEMYEYSNCFIFFCFFVCYFLHKLVSTISNIQRISVGNQKVKRIIIHIIKTKEVWIFKTGFSYLNYYLRVKRIIQLNDKNECVLFAWGPFYYPR